MARRTLDRSPRLLPLYARSAGSLIPGASRLPMIPGGHRRVPHYELILGQARIDARRLAAYLDVCGFPRGDALPATCPHVLAFPLHMRLMSDGRFPFGPVGLVQLANAITQHRPIAVGQPLELCVRGTPLQPHPRGRTFSILTEARVGGELVWEGESTLLRREGGGSGAGAAAGPEASAPPARAGSEWQLPADLGRRYAAASGDRNPIHLHAVAARLFGFPRAIAHGMWTKARCLAALDDVQPETLTIAVRFRRPIQLPGAVAFALERRDGASSFALRDAADRDVIHVEGTLTR